ncbi:MAG: hypothetical protein ABIH00_06480 [Armatimonadota bacterium]
MQEKIIKPVLTKFYLFSLIPLFLSILLIINGNKNLKVFASTQEVFTKFLVGYLPMLFGIIIILVLLVLFASNVSKKITVTPVSIKYSCGKKEFTTPWKNLIFATTPPEKKHFKQITLSDGVNFGKIDDFFFPQYDLIIQVIYKAKEAGKEETFNI